ncbi:UNVERIFIED_CONTAM: hypothetical protein FKN15_058574 [Acipenser sinensis]
MADTLPLEEPGNESTPIQNTRTKEQARSNCITDDVIKTVVSDSEECVASTSRASSTAQNTCYREYTNLYAPIFIEDDEEVGSDNAEHTDLPVETWEDSLSASDIIGNLSQVINSNSCSRFNINRSSVWDGAVRGFKRASYNTNSELFVKFTDDAGCFEEAIDTGGPKREFLTLLISCLRDRPIFDGPSDS